MSRRDSALIDTAVIDEVADINKEQKKLLLSIINSIMLPADAKFGLSKLPTHKIDVQGYEPIRQRIR